MIKINEAYLVYTICLDYKVPTLQSKIDWKTKVISKISKLGYLSEINEGGGNIITIKLVPGGSYKQIDRKELLIQLTKILEEERTEIADMKTVWKIYRITEDGLLKEPKESYGTTVYEEYQTKEEALKAIKSKGEIYIHDLIIVECLRKNTNLG